jgi:hypothetical protein
MTPARAHSVEPNGTGWNPSRRTEKKSPSGSPGRASDLAPGDGSGRDTWASCGPSAAAWGRRETGPLRRLESDSVGGPRWRPSERDGQLPDIAWPRAATSEACPARFVGIFAMTADDVLDLSRSECHGDSVPRRRRTFNQANAAFSVNDRPLD